MKPAPGLGSPIPYKLLFLPIYFYLSEFPIFHFIPSSKKNIQKRQNRFCGIENPATFAPPYENGQRKRERREKKRKRSE
jgi:hypothetical protein